MGAGAVKDWREIFGVAVWLVIDMSIIGTAIYATRVYDWKPLLNYLDLNKESIR